MLGRNAPPVVAMAPETEQGVAPTPHMLACLAVALHPKLEVVKVSRFSNVTSESFLIM